MSILEVGLAAGMTSMFLMLLSAMVNFLLKSAPNLMQMDSRKIEQLTTWSNSVYKVIDVAQVIMLIVY